MGIRIRARNLADVSPRRVLRGIRRRNRAGLPMTARAVKGHVLLDLARFHFGGWYEAVAAAGLKPEGKPARRKPQRQAAAKLRPLTESLLRGTRSSAELERMTGVRADTIRTRRRSLGLHRDERQGPDRTWLGSVREFLGKRADTELAELAGVDPSTIATARRELGIPAYCPADGEPGSPTTPLHQVPPRDVLREIRARVNAGESLVQSEVGSVRLLRLADFHFGGWYRAVEAAGYTPPGKPSRREEEVRRPEKLRELTPALLRGPKASRELERLTGITRTTIRARRERMGIGRDERIVKDLSWVADVRHLLGKVSDVEVARRAGVRGAVVGRVRKELGIPCPPRRSLARSDELREQLRGYRRSEIERALSTLKKRPAAVLRARVFSPQFETLEEIGLRLGITRQSVRWHETKGLVHLLADLEKERTRRTDRRRSRRRRKA